MTKDRSKYCILVVNDHEATRYGTARALRAAGFVTAEAASGSAALELAEFASAVVLDVHLPDVVGFEVARLLRAKPTTATLPIVHVSAVYTSAADEAAGKAAGADAYLVAPYDHAAMVAILDRLLQARDLQRL